MKQKESKVRILSIDPGYDRCGVAIIDVEHGKTNLVFSGCAQTSRKNSELQRLQSIGSYITTCLETYTPDESAIEKLFFTNNQQTAMLVAQAVGVIKFIIESKKTPLFEYTPMEVKVAVSGHGRASKEDVHQMVTKLIHLPTKKMLDDEVDAIAVGLTHEASRRSVNKFPL